MAKWILKSRIKGLAGVYLALTVLVLFFYLLCSYLNAIWYFYWVMMKSIVVAVTKLTFSGSGEGFLGRRWRLFNRGIERLINLALGENEPLHMDIGGEGSTDPGTHLPSSASSSQSGGGLPDLNESPSPASVIKEIREDAFSSPKKVPDLNESPEDEEKLRNRIRNLLDEFKKDTLEHRKEVEQRLERISRALSTRKTLLDRYRFFSNLPKFFEDKEKRRGGQ